MREAGGFSYFRQKIKHMQAPHYLYDHLICPCVLRLTRSGSFYSARRCVITIASGGRITLREDGTIAAFHPFLTVFGILSYVYDNTYFQVQRQVYSDKILS
jgi:hypothetical protein